MLPPTKIHACFRFDFIVETAFDELEEWLKNSPGLNIDAIRRKADAAFPPIAETVWIDDELLPLDSDCLEDLNRPLSKNGDWNVNQDRWPLVLSRFGPCNWGDLCADTRRKAEEALRQRHDITNLTQRCVSAFETSNALVQEQGRSRIDALFGRKAEQSRLTEEIEQAQRVAERITIGIRVRIGNDRLSDLSATSAARRWRVMRSCSLVGA